MLRPSPCRFVTACGWTCLVVGARAAARAGRGARADEPPPRLAVGTPAHEGRAEFPLPGPAGPRAGRSVGASGGWWLGAAVLALGLAVLGGISLAARRFGPARGSGPLEVVGRASLSPKHTVYLLRVGDRILIVGAGAQGPPSLLGEWTGPIDGGRPAPGAPPSTSMDPPSLAPRSGGES
jgi:flagellar protein FliO/FliZ